MLKITDVKIYMLDGKTSLKAFANITIDECFVVKNLKVVEGKKGLFVSMPSSKGSDGEYYDDCFPITAEARETVNDAVLDAFEAAESKPAKSKRR